MEYTFAPMTAEAARVIQTWRYDPPYNIYNTGGDPDDALAAEWLDARSPYFAAYEAAGDLVGFCCCGTAALPWDVAAPGITDGDGELALGLGLRPDRTGRGLGLAFVRAVLAFAAGRFRPTGFFLYVLAFNQRAITVYARAGFIATRTLHIENTYGPLDFVEMRRGIAGAV
jgi:ribosomal-protein-alanine N-acetyltransferase